MRGNTHTSFNWRFDMSESSGGASPQSPGSARRLEQDSVLEALLVRPRRCEDESDIGFLLRTADQNGLSVGARLLSAVGYQFFGRVRICARCCGEPESHWPTSWEDWTRPWCERHGVWLVDECSSCGVRLSAARLGFRICRCKARLCEQPAEPVPASILEMVDAEAGNLPMAFWLGAMVLQGVSGKPGKLEACRSAASVRNVIELGSRTMVEWPHAFLAAMTTMRLRPSSGGAIAQLVEEAFPGLNRALRRVPETWVQRVAEALDALIRSECESGRPLIGKNWFVATRVATVQESARALGVSFARLRRALDKQCDDVGSRRVTRRGRLRAVFSEDDLTVLSSRLSDAIGMKTAARELGVKVDRVGALVQCGRLSRAGDGRLSRIDVTRFQEELLRSAPALRDLETGFISVAEAFKRWIRVRDTAGFFDAVSAGLIERRRLPGPDRSLRALRMHADGVRTWLRRNESAGCAIDAA